MQEIFVALMLTTFV